MDDAAVRERRQRDAEMRAAINQQLVETGEKERLKENLRQALRECNWREDLKARCKEVVQERGLDKITVEELIAAVTPDARRLVPDEVKEQLLRQIKDFLEQQKAI